MNGYALIAIIFVCMTIGGIHDRECDTIEPFDTMVPQPNRSYELGYKHED